MENIIQNPGLQHITEMILLDLDFEDLQTCQPLSKSCQEIIENPMFWLRKLRAQRGLSEKNYNDWAKAIQSARNTNMETNVKLYLQKVIKNGHVVDFPCFIDADALENSTRFTFEKALKERNLGVLQILASMERDPNHIVFYDDNITTIEDAASAGHLNIVKILAPITIDPISSPCEEKFNPIHEAAYHGHVDIIKFLLSFTNDRIIPDNCGRTPIWYAANRGHIDVLKFLAPLSKNPNKPPIRGPYSDSPIERAQKQGHHEFARILQTYINTGHF